MKHHTQTAGKSAGHKVPVLAWGTILGVLACGAGLWVRFGSMENAVSAVCTILATAVLALSLVLSVISQPRTR